MRLFGSEIRICHSAAPCPDYILVINICTAGCLGMRAMKHKSPQSNWLHHAEGNNRKKYEDEERRITCLSEKKSYFQSSLSLSVPYLLLIGKKEVKNMKILWKTFIRVLGNCLHQRWQFAAWLISFERLYWLCIPGAAWNFENGSGQSSPEQCRARCH